MDAAMGFVNAKTPILPRALLSVKKKPKISTLNVLLHAPLLMLDANQNVQFNMPRMLRTALVRKLT